MEVKDVAVIIQIVNQIATPLCILGGAWIASSQFGLTRRQRVLTAITEVLKEISDEKFGYKDGKLLRHWVCQRSAPLTMPEFDALTPDEKQRMIALIMAHDRVAFFLEQGGGELRSLYDWQKHELDKVWTNLVPVILHMRGEQKDFCHKLEGVAKSGLALQQSRRKLLPV